MHKGRLEAFSDGVIAIIITIMVLEFKVPESGLLTALLPMLPNFLAYILSFIFIGIYWNNHHHLFQAAQHVNGRILWANLHLLFWLSLIPFTTAWMGHSSGTSPWPIAIYGIDLLFSGVAYYILSQSLIRHHGHQSALSKAIGRDTKGRISLVIYLCAIPLAFVTCIGAYALYVCVALMWLVPDRRIEDAIRN